LFGNLYFSNRALELGDDGVYADIGGQSPIPWFADTGFRFDAVRDATTTIACADVNGDGVTDLVAVGNTDERDRLFVRRRRPVSP
jgi:hypothetical protein